MSLLFVVGTRPELIKMAPVIREAQRRGTPFRFIHTGQHYSENMDAVFFSDLGLPKPDVNLGVGSKPPGKQTAEMLEKLEAYMQAEKPDVVIVQGDTNSVLSACLAASKLRIALAHVEAGLRSRDWRQPEEKNRIVADHLSDWLFAPSQRAANHLAQEGLNARTLITGNTVVDAVIQHREVAAQKSAILARLGLTPQAYLLATAHREEYVDDPARLNDVVSALDQTAQKLAMPVVFPIHPRTQKRLDAFDIRVPSTIRTISPLGYLDFLALESNAKLILTDSGGVQEEACILGVPCVVLREYSDRPESIDV
ncbi:MAG: UDP-N-acetylglucosamine 2-epimerase (non-hydrolyzing), partial [Candidatus Micrarchaeota archaeon]|nr:UDP-N-acetylglucosamine 2-epimerase (non-hydrolyzing) [Candidatus Micrarchaeota archaeon]